MLDPPGQRDQPLLRGLPDRRDQPLLRGLPDQRRLLPLPDQRGLLATPDQPDHEGQWRPWGLRHRRGRLDRLVRCRQ